VTDPQVKAAVLAAVITGAIALAIAATTAITTWLTLRRQREAENERRLHDRYMRLVESGLRAAVDFLAAADRTTRARQGLDTANISLDQAKSSSDQEVYQRFLAKVEEAREEAFAAVADAEYAYSALRLLIPYVADRARRYLDCCIGANAHPDDGKVDRHRARQMLEETLRHALGGDLSDKWMFAEPQSQVTPERKIPLQRKAELDTDRKAPRQSGD
jgi:hypothetical protein